jgi:cyanophycin synthetase
VPPNPSCIRLHPEWRALQGVAYGLREPTAQGSIDVALPQDYSFAALDEVMRPLFDEEIALPEESSGTAEAMVYRLLYWHAVAQRQQKIPVFGNPRILAARHVAGIGQFMVAVPYHTPQATHQALGWMAKTLNDLLNARKPGAHVARVMSDFDELVRSLRVHALGGINNFHLLRAAHDLEIPARALFGDTYCFGYGAHSRWLNSTQTDETSSLGVSIAASKRKTAHVLSLSGVPVPRHSLAHDERHALELARNLGYPVVIKPDDQEQGRGVSAGLRDDSALVIAYRAALEHSRTILVEKHHHGEDYRLTVLKDRVVKILRRSAGGVTGDGVHSIAELLASTQETSRFRSYFRQHGKPLLDLDDEALGLLTEHGLLPEHVPNAGHFVALRRKNNISAGGVQTLIPLAEVHPDNIALAVRSARAALLDLCGVDLLTPDISKSWLETGAVIIELNSKPQVGTALAPEVYGQMLQELLNGDGRVPVHLLVCVTGPDCPEAQQLQAFMQDRDCNGLATAQGVWVDGAKIGGAENSFQAARIALLDKAITGALCAMTAQDIIRHGLPVDRFDSVTVAGQDAAPDADKLALTNCMAMLKGGTGPTITSLPQFLRSR